MGERLKLGVNIDHVATLREARYAKMGGSGNAEPELLEAARACERAGADSITVHLREDRRHIQDRDVYVLREQLEVPMNLEMGNTAEILRIALEVGPKYVCLVPENRAEVTTEGGLDAAGKRDELRPTIEALSGRGILVSLFIDPEPAQVDAAAELGAPMIELHTGAFALGGREGSVEEADRLRAAAIRARGLGLEVHAGHGISLFNLERLFAVPYLQELNVGHHLVARAVMRGLETVVREMKERVEGYRFEPVEDGEG